MKSKIKYIFLITILFVMSTLQSLSSPSPPDTPCVCCPPFKLLGIDCIPPSAFLSEDLGNALGSLSSTCRDLSHKTKIARPFSIRILSLVKRIKTSLNLPADKCSEQIESNLEKINLLIGRLEMKNCNVNDNGRCISDDVLSEFIQRLKDSLEGVRSIIQVDDDETGISDVCGG